MAGTSVRGWNTDARAWTLVVAWIGFVLAVYCRDIGRGFVKDDFTWIRSAQAAAATPSTLVLQRDAGFYRPLITSSFLLDHSIHDWNPRGYGWTNLTLYVGCATAIAALGLVLGLTRWAAVLAAFVWAVNPHGINMAVVWLSGRTALFLTLFSVTAAIAFLRRRYLIAGILIALALASKEEALMLPIVLLAWALMRRRAVPLSVGGITAATVPLGIYILLRGLTPAFTPATAPAFYQFTLDPQHLFRNFGEYLDRSVTIAAIVLLVSAIVLRTRPTTGERERRLMQLCAAWWAGMFAITMWLPVRSSLYAVCPSVASALVVAALVDAMRSRDGARRRPLEAVLALMLLAAVPAYQARNHTWVEAARVSQRTIATIRSDVRSLPEAGTIVLRDEPGTVSSFHNAFGDLATEALQTAFGRAWRATIAEAEPQPIDGAQVIAEYRLEHGRIVRVPREP